MVRIDSPKGSRWPWVKTAAVARRNQCLAGMYRGISGQALLALPGRDLADVGLDGHPIDRLRQPVSDQPASRFGRAACLRASPG